jgi:hypothetical protein
MLGVSENRALRKIFGPKRDEVTVLEERSYIFCIAHQILLK